MKSTLIDISHHNTYEDWLVVYDDGSIMYHSELDGWAAKRGTKPTNELLTMAEVHERFPHKVDEVRQALRSFGKL